MRKTALMGVSLTLLMLLLVLSSAFIFLFQGRQKLVVENESVTSSLAQAQQELDITYNTLDASGRALATAEATNLLLEGQLVRSQQEIDSTSLALATRTAEFAEVSSERDQYLSQPPVIEIIAPTANESLLLGETMAYDIIVADGVGVTAVLVSIDDEQIDAFSLTGNQTERVIGEWTPTGVGNVILGVQASNSRTSVLVTQTLSIAAPIGEIVPLGGAPFRSERLMIETAVQETRRLLLANSANISVNFQTEQEQWQNQLPLISSLTVTESLTAWSLFDLGIDDFFLTETTSPFDYDPQRDTLNINGLGATFDPIDAYHYVSAYTSLLLDQNFTAVDDTFLPLDAQLAQRSLLAGDVANVQSSLLSSDLFSLEDIATINEAMQNQPRASIEQLLLQGGLTFATFFGTEESIPVLNDAWQSPPATSEQIFHPEKYLAQEPAELVTLPDLSAVLGEDWSLFASETAGEIILRLYLGSLLNEAQVETAVSGWGGDRFTIYQNQNGEVILLLKVVWDSVEDSNEFAALYPNYPTRLFTAAGTLNDLGECWSGEDVICLFQNGIETAVVRAPSLNQALAIGEVLVGE